MTPLEPLAPDQRAVVALILRQGRSYDDIAGMLGMPIDAVRARAQAGLAALAPANGLPGEITGPLADYLLGQQPARDAEATRGLLDESAPARAWATDVATSLAGVAPGPLPEIPAGESAPSDPAPSMPASEAHEPALVAAPAKPPAPRPRPVREPPAPAAPAADAPPAASLLGGVLLIAAVLAVVGVVLFLVLRGGEDPGAEQSAAPTAPSATPAPSATQTPSATAAPQLADEIPLRAAAPGKAKGTMTVYLQGDQLLFALEAQDVPPNGATTSYAVWFSGPGNKARRLGFTDPVGEDGRLGIQGPSEKDLADFQRLFATYENVVVSEESREDAKRPAKIVLIGKLPAGR